MDPVLEDGDVQVLPQMSRPLLSPPGAVEEEVLRVLTGRLTVRARSRWCAAPPVLCGEEVRRPVGPKLEQGDVCGPRSPPGGRERDAPGDPTVDVVCRDLLLVESGGRCAGEVAAHHVDRRVEGGVGSRLRQRSAVSGCFVRPLVQGKAGVPWDPHHYR